MKRFQKLAIIIATQLALLAFFLNFSEGSTLATTIVFPPLFAVTIYFFIITTLRVEHKSSRNIHFLYALLLASVALLATGTGFHFAANDINDVFIPTLGVELQEEVTARIAFLDEEFSHWVMLLGMSIIAVVFIAWYLVRKQDDTKNDVKLLSESEILNAFMISFASTLIGALGALASIEAGITSITAIVVAILAITSPLVFYAFKRTRPSLAGKDSFIFYLTLMASYLAVSVAYWIVKAGKWTIFVKPT